MAENKFQVNIPTRTLNSGHDIPVIGLGTWLGFEEGKFNEKDIPTLINTLCYAIDIGYRHLDTAHLYRTERAVGEAVAKKIEEGVIRREDVYITTKVWNHMHSYEDVQKSIKGSLKRLKTDYVDLCLVHWPVAYTTTGEDAKIDYLETWRGMEAAQAAGLARSIGVSNFSVDQLRRLLENCKVKPAMNQIELSLNLLQPELVDFCQSQGIAVTAYTPFGTLLPGRDPEGSPEPKLRSPVMVELAKKYGKSATQIVLRFFYQKGIIPIPKTIKRSRVLQNCQIFDFAISHEDMETLSSFDCSYRTIWQEQWQDHPDYPFERRDIVVPDIPEFLLDCED